MMWVSDWLLIQKFGSCLAVLVDSNESFERFWIHTIEYVFVLEWFNYSCARDHQYVQSISCGWSSRKIIWIAWQTWCKILSEYSSSNVFMLFSFVGIRKEFEIIDWYTRRFEIRLANYRRNPKSVRFNRSKNQWC